MFWKYSDAKYEKKVKQNIRKTATANTGKIVLSFFRFVTYIGKSLLCKIQSSQTGDIKEVENHDSLMELSGKYVVLYNRRRA